MNPDSRLGSAFAGALILGALLQVAPASAAPPGRVGTVFFIYIENHNWVQPNGNVDNSPGSGLEQIKGNPAAPYLNSLVDPKSPNSTDVSYTNNCYNVLATPSGRNPSIHPSEPNYIWQEGGSNFGVTSDADPYGDSADPAGNVFSQPCMSGLLQAAGIPWDSFQEDIDLIPSGGSVNQPAADSLTGAVAPRAQWTVPLATFGGTSAAYTNPYNGSHQYYFAPKHDGALFSRKRTGERRAPGTQAPRTRRPRITCRSRHWNTIFRKTGLGG